MKIDLFIKFYSINISDFEIGYISLQSDFFHYLKKKKTKNKKRE